MNDEFYIEKAVALAKKGTYLVNPGVKVGCVITKNNKILGEGYYEYFGGPHAEVNAINSIKNKFGKKYRDILKGSTLYVTLEPCSKKGKTEACTKLLKEYDFEKIIVGSRDPTQKGIEDLKKAGKNLKILKSVNCECLNENFFFSIKNKRPFVRAKVAMSKDEKSSFISSKRKWITSLASRKDAQKFRAISDLVLTGSGTIKRDRPSLNVRDKKIINLKKFKQPARGIISSSVEIDSSIPFFNLSGDKIIFTNSKSSIKKGSALRDVEIKKCKENKGKIDLKDVLKKAFEFGSRSLLLEAGPTLVGAFGDLNLIDEYVFYISSEKLGKKGLHFYKGEAKYSLFDSNLFEIVSKAKIGNDLKVIARRK